MRNYWSIRGGKLCRAGPGKAGPGKIGLLRCGVGDLLPGPLPRSERQDRGPDSVDSAPALVGVRSIAIIEAAWRSARERRSVAVEVE